MRHILLAFTLAVGLGAITALPMRAQQSTPATLIADSIVFSSGTNSITASGGVEIFYEGSRLRARSVQYDGTGDRVMVEGPLTLIEGNGRSIILADFADLSADLQDGVLQSARLVLDRQLQIAATEIERSDGRFTQLYQTVASTCEVCEDNPIPLWEIRARRIVHDQEEQQLYFEQAQFRALGLPIFYAPRMRLPDPTLERATGFLTPSIVVSEDLGTGVRVPYFFELGDHADLTLTPFLTFGDSQTLEARYRQAFRNGRIEVNGAISDDDLTLDDHRGYLFAVGRFDMARDFVLDFQIQGVTDPTYLLTYGYSEEDRLESNVTLSRARRDEYIEGNLSIYNSLRAGDSNRTLPTRVADGEYIRRLTPGMLGGIATLSASAHTHYRIDDTDITGRDVSRISAAADWRRDWVLPAGLLLAFETEVIADLYAINQDSTFPESESRVTPYAAVELRWPWAATTARGVTHLIEPVAQLAWSDAGSAMVPNEDGVVVEFDEANLFALNRFPGTDGREDGARANLGVTYTRTDPLGWSLGVTVGRVIRQRDIGQFTPGSGLDGRRSDWLAALHLSLGQRLTLINRALITDAGNLRANELEFGLDGEALDMSSTLIFLEADPAEGRPVDISEWAMNFAYDFDSAWGAEVSWRYDFETNEPTRAALALNYATECVDVEFSLSRRYTSSVTLVPATEFGLTIALNGFGATRNGRRYDRSCHR